jgi:hypothetical protein
MSRLRGVLVGDDVEAFAGAGFVVEANMGGFPDTGLPGSPLEREISTRSSLGNHLTIGRQQSTSTANSSTSNGTWVSG